MKKHSALLLVIQNEQTDSIIQAENFVLAHDLARMSSFATCEEFLSMSEEWDHSLDRNLGLIELAQNSDKRKFVVSVDSVVSLSFWDVFDSFSSIAHPNQSKIVFELKYSGGIVNYR